MRWINEVESQMNETNERMNGNASKQTGDEKIAHQIHSHTQCKWSTVFIYFIYDLVSTANIKWRVQHKAHKWIESKRHCEKKPGEICNERWFMSDNERRMAFASVSFLVNGSNYGVRYSIITQNIVEEESHNQKCDTEHHFDIDRRRYLLHLYIWSDFIQLNELNTEQRAFKCHLNFT